MHGDFDSAGGAHQSDTRKHYGKYAGRVLDNAPPEDGKHRGELLVEVPGILEETPGDKSPRPLQVLAKPCFLPGFFFIPTPEAPVWVEFVAGDVNAAVWTGVWYPTDATPKTHTDEAPTEFQRIIRTSSGHVIQIDDTDEDEQIIVHHKTTSVAAINKDGDVRIAHHGGASVEIKKDSLVEIAADSVKIKGEVTLDGIVHITKATDIEGDLIVGGKGPTTTISGNAIKGGA